MSNLGFYLREDDAIRKIHSLTGKEYYLRKLPYGFGEQYIFYNQKGEEIEVFYPNNDLEVEGFYDFEDDEKVLFEGMEIIDEFSYSEFYM